MFALQGNHWKCYLRLGLPCFANSLQFGQQDLRELCVPVFVNVETLAMGAENGKAKVILTQWRKVFLKKYFFAVLGLRQIESHNTG